MVQATSRLEFGNLVDPKTRMKLTCILNFLEGVIFFLHACKPSHRQRARRR
ncbi:MAG: hypothetical protein GYA24_15055 [Candidatus Lokiarchaeota archaeon]|nr:hypothetical protein [Candidatus Lokiarchaeota archaeon]